MKFDPTNVKIIRSGRKLAFVDVRLNGTTISSGARPQNHAFAQNVRNHLMTQCDVIPTESNNVTSFTRPSTHKAAA